MCVDRRGFMEIAAVSAGAALLSSRGASAEERPLPDAVGRLKPMLDGVQPITDEERKGRIEKARRLMAEAGLGAVYIESGSSLFYYTGVRWGQSERMFAMVMPREGEPAFVCPAFEEARARELIRFGDDVRTWEEHESPYALVAKILTDRGVRTGKIGIEERVRFFLADGIQKECPALEMVTADPVTVGCRVIKSDAELALMKRANEITIEAYKAAVASLQEGMTHVEVSGIISSAFQKMGVQGGAGVQFGEYSAFPHGSREPQTLKEGDIVMMDGGCGVEGYRSDITRTVVFGKPGDRQRQLWDLERKAQDAARDAVRPGVPCEAIDAAARKVITDGGFGPDYKYFTHRVGHGIGLDGHEWTYLVRGNKTPLAPGMCFSNEPGIYLYGEFGVRLEDCFHVTEDGGELFTKQSPSVDDPFGVG
ncbi:MAG TPA: Xaa-Pro peptidase family protein [Vicinamibacteria bacterium]|nr:Xaa-Pro peptidase family protein [Vicinamibacteria bacterium]